MSRATGKFPNIGKNVERLPFPGLYNPGSYNQLGRGSFFGLPPVVANMQRPSLSNDKNFLPSDVSAALIASQNQYNPQQLPSVTASTFAQHPQSPSPEQENDTLKGSQLQDNKVLESLRDKLVAVTEKLEEAGLEIDGNPADLKPGVSASEMQQTAGLTPEEDKKTFLNIYRPKENPLKQQRPPGQRGRRSIELSGSLEKPKDTLQNPGEPVVEYQDVYKENTSLEEVPYTDNPMNLAEQLSALRKKSQDLAAENKRLQEALSSRDANDQSLQDLFESNESLFITEDDLKALQALQQSRVEGPSQDEPTPEMQALEMGESESKENLSNLLQEYGKPEGKNLLNALRLGQIYRQYDAMLSFLRLRQVAQEYSNEKSQVEKELSIVQQVNQDLRGQLQAAKDDKAGSTASLQAINTQLLDQYKTLKEALDKAEKSNSTSKNSPSSKGGLNLVPLGRSNQSSPSQLSEQAVTDQYQIKEEDSVQVMIAKNQDLVQLVALCQQQKNAAQIEALVKESNTEKKQLSYELSQAKETLTTAQNSHATALVDLRAQQDEALKDVKEAQSLLSASKQKEGELQTKFDGLQSQLAELNSENSTLQAEKGDQAREIISLQEKIEKVENELQESKEASQQASKQSQQAVEKLTAALTASEQSTAKLTTSHQAELGALQTKLDASEQSNNKIEEEKKSLQDGLTRAEDQVSSLTDEIVTLTEKYESQVKDLAASQTEGAKQGKVSGDLIKALRAQVNELTAGKKDVEVEREALRIQLKKDQETSSREQDFMKEKLAKIERQRDFAQEKLDIFLNPHWSEKINSFAQSHRLGSLAGESRNNVKAYLQRQAVAELDVNAAKQRSEEAELSLDGAKKAFNDFFKGYEGVLLGDIPAASGNQPTDNTQKYLSNFKKTAEKVLKGESQQRKKRGPVLASNFFSDPDFRYSGENDSNPTFDGYINQGEIKWPNKREGLTFDRAKFQAVSLAYHNAWQEKLAAKSALEAATKESTAYESGGTKEEKLLVSIQKDAQKREAEADALDVLQDRVPTLELDLQAAQLREQELNGANTALEQKIITLKEQAAMDSKKSEERLVKANDTYKQSLGEMKQEMASTAESAKQAAVTANTDQLQREFAAEKSRIEGDHKKALEQAGVGYSESLRGLQQDMEQLQESLSQKDAALTTLRVDLEKAGDKTKLNEELQTRIEELEAAVQEKEGELSSNSDAGLKILQSTSEKYQQIIDRYKGEIDTLRNENTKLETQHAGKIEKLETKVATLEKQKDSINQSYKQSRDEVDQSILALQRANKVLEAEKEALQGDREGLVAAQSEQQEENEALRMQVDELETRLAASSQTEESSAQKAGISALLTNMLKSRNASLTSQVAEKDEQINSLTQEIAQLRQQNLSLSTTPQSDPFPRYSSALSDQQEVAGGNKVATPRVRSASDASLRSKNSLPNQGGVGGGSLSPELVSGRSALSGNLPTSSRDSNSLSTYLNTAFIGRESSASSKKNDPSSLKPGQDFCLEYARTVKDDKGTEVIKWDDQKTFEASKQHYAHAEQVRKTVSSSSGDGGEKTYPTELADNAYHTVRATWSDDSQAEKAGRACMEAYLDMMGGIEAVAALYDQTAALKQAKSSNMDALVMNLTQGEKAIPISGSEAFQNGARAALMSRVREVSPKNDFRNRLNGYGYGDALTNAASIGRKSSTNARSVSSPPFDLRSPSSGRNHRSQSNPHPRLPN